MRVHTLLTVATLAIAASLGVAPSDARMLRSPIDDSETIVLRGNVHPLARAESDVGRTAPSLPLERMILSLRLDPDRRAELERLLAGQQDPASPDFHRWLTPEQFGERFGASAADLAAVTGWLRSHGFAIDEVGKGGTWINFTGTAGDVERTFHTKIHDYLVDGELHHANSVDPAIPRALAELVAGVVSLHDFQPKVMPNFIQRPPAERNGPATNMSGGAHWLSPADFATIYNVNPLYAAGVDGTGQTVAIVGRSNMNLADAQYFRSISGLPANDPQFIINGADPGNLGGNEELEAVLDVEWSGAVAKNATITFVISKSTNASGGDALSQQYIVNNNLAPVMSSSFYQCETSLGSAANTFYNNLWAQAAAQGITSFVASGDAGAAGCNVGTDTLGSGQATSGLCSTPYDVCVGGTQFMDTGNPSAYWAPANDSTTMGSALSYIPEQAWNESSSTSGGSGLWSTGGGPSQVYAKPSWQVAPGVPNDGVRDTPDVSLASAGHNAYIIIQDHTASVSGLKGALGTSAASPSFAGLMALIVQKTGARQGNANPRLYQLANAQYTGGGPVIFHDVTTGDNSVPGVAGFSCGAGYDLATGLGSVDAASLVNYWTSGDVPDFAISVSPPAVSAAQGGFVTTNVATSVFGGFSSALSLSVSGLPTGASATLNPTSIAAPGGGSATLTLTAAAATPAGTYTVSITATGGGKSHAAQVSFTVNAASGNIVTIFSDGFEGTFPATWQLLSSAGADTTTTWGRSTYRAAGGSASLWCAGGGTNAQAPGGDYVPTMGTFAVQGPFSLTDATAATLDFDLWYDTELNSDFVWYTISVDGRNFSGFKLSGTSGGWVHRTLNFSDVTQFNAIGAPQVWVAFLFTSDASVQGKGAYVDNVVIKKTTSSTCSVPSITTQPANQTVTPGQTPTLTVAATGATAYQWYRGASGETASPISGATSSSYTTAPSYATASYWVRVSNACGAANSNTAVITVAGGGTGYLYLVPSVAHLKGKNQTTWRTDVSAVNPSGQTANIVLSYFSASSAFAPVSSQSLAPAATIVWRDILVALFHLDPNAQDKGVLKISSDVPLAAVSRTYNQGATGTFGQSYPALAPSWTLSPGQTGILPLLSSNASFRTNLGVANLATGVTCPVVATLYGATGNTLGHAVTLTVDAGRFKQQDDIFGATGAGARDLAYATVEVATAGCKVWAYASVVDNATGDPTTIELIVP